MDEYIVFVKVDENGVITAINSSAFICGAGWEEIDKGEGDKFHHAQGNYLEQGLVDEDGIFNYKLINGDPILRSDDDKAPERARLAAALEVTQLSTLELAQKAQAAELAALQEKIKELLAE